MCTSYCPLNLIKRSPDDFLFTEQTSCVNNKIFIKTTCCLYNPLQTKWYTYCDAMTMAVLFIKTCGGFPFFQAVLDSLMLNRRTQEYYFDAAEGSWDMSTTLNYKCLHFPSSLSPITLNSLFFSPVYSLKNDCFSFSGMKQKVEIEASPCSVFQYHWFSFKTNQTCLTLLCPLCTWWSSHWFFTISSHRSFPLAFSVWLPIWCHFRIKFNSGIMNSLVY